MSTRWFWEWPSFVRNTSAARNAWRRWCREHRALVILSPCTTSTPARQEPVFSHHLFMFAKGTSYVTAMDCVIKSGRLEIKTLKIIRGIRWLYVLYYVLSGHCITRFTHLSLTMRKVGRAIDRGLRIDLSVYAFLWCAPYQSLSHQGTSQKWSCLTWYWKNTVYKGWLKCALASWLD